MARIAHRIGTLSVALFIGACSVAPVSDRAAIPPATTPALATLTAHDVLLIDRITWGVNPSTLRDATQQGIDDYIRAQLRGTQSPDLPAAIHEQIAAMTIERTPVERLGPDVNRRRLAVDGTRDDTERDRARSVYQQELQKLGREAMTRTLLRAVYSSNQLREQMTWFWFDHFNVNQNKNVVRALIGDYEDRAIRRHALGRFRDLLGAVVRHPAMLIYLDNAQNATGRINENFARELMELHTLGVDGGYTQGDVQELARILTGVGVNLRDPAAAAPRIRPAVRDDYVRDGLFEFNPNRHDYGAKSLLGRPIAARGLKEVDEALDRLAAHPSTARFVSRKIATFFVSDSPDPALVDRIAAEFTRTDGEIASTLSVLFSSPEFAASLGRKFKDPVHYVVSSVRFAYDDATIVNAQPMIAWLNRMGQPLFGRQTPDGYPATADAWTSPAQLSTRFEIARAIVAGSGRLMFRPDGERADRPAARLTNVMHRLSPATRTALGDARSRDDWNVLLLASPEFQHR